jgi:hypothetical protein
MVAKPGWILTMNFVEPIRFLSSIGSLLVRVVVAVLVPLMGVVVVEVIIDPLGM